MSAVGTNIEPVSSSFARPFAGFAVCFAVVAGHAGAARAECAPPTPECHLKAGKKLIDRDPKRASVELLASYKLDERTETLTLYATALQSDKQYARALETWQRIIVFRESEMEAAKENMKLRKKAAAAKQQMAVAQEASEHAAAQIMALWPNVAKVKVNLAGQPYVVTRGGDEVDVTKEILVNANKDELVFTRSDGSSQKVLVAVLPGQVKTIDAPIAKAPALVGTPARKLPEQRRIPDTVEPLPTVTEEPSSVIEARTEDRYIVEPRSRSMSRIGVGLMAGGVVALGVATTFGIIANNKFDDAKDAGCDDDGECPVGRAANLGEQARDNTRVMQISAIGGGALLVTGATLWWLGRTETRTPSDSISIRVDTTSTSASASIGWSFQ